MPLGPNRHLYWPRLRDDDFKEASPATSDYNCIAWAAGQTNKWWWPSEDSYWPLGALRQCTLAAFAQAYALSGYEPCIESGLEPGFEKVALYTDGDEPTHAARQLPDGRWTSKLGRQVDIEHVELGCLEGNYYGRVALILRRRRV